MTKRIEIEPELLLALYWGNNYTQTYIATLFNCTKTTVCSWMKIYNIPIDKERLGRFEKGIIPNGSVLFEKGHKPWNTNLKGIHLCPENEFKLGHPAPTTAFKKNDERITRENNYNWKGGVSSINNIIRSSEEYKEWRIKIFERDNYTCRLCNSRNVHIHAHHILNFANYKNNRFNVNNGITLCIKCHNNVHSSDKIIRDECGRFAQYLFDMKAKELEKELNEMS